MRGIQGGKSHKAKGSSSTLHSISLKMKVPPTTIIILVVKNLVCGTDR